MPIVDLPLARLAAGARRAPHLDPGRVSFYTEHFDEVSPVVVFDIDGLLLLADGHHRIAAAERLGRSTVKADLRKGRKGDALQFAVDLAQQQSGLTEQKVLEAIARRARLAGGDD